MKRTTCAVMMAGLAFSVFAAPARAQDAGPGGDPSTMDQAGPAPQDGHGPEMSAAKLKDKLGLSDDQVAKLDAAWKAGKDAAKPFHDQMKKDLDKLRDQVKSKASDDDIKATLDDMDSARKGLRDAMEKAKADSDGILTPTQRAKMALRMAHRMKEMREKMHGKGKDHHPKGPPAEGGAGDQPAPPPQPAQ